MSVTGEQIVSTLSNVRREVEQNGVTEAASDMWLHALSMYRREKMIDDPVARFDDTQLPSLLRPQAD